MTASELHELFCRYCPDEQIAQVRIDQADYCERETVARLSHLRLRWRQMGLGWRP
jgi:hypothetical protein